MRQADIGRALDALADDIRALMLDLVRQSRMVDAPPMMRAVYEIDLIKQAVDTPYRARAQIAAWIASYNARHSGGAQAFLNSCLAAAGSAKTIVDVSAELAEIEAQAQVLVARVNDDGWSWEQVAAALEAQAPPEEELSFRSLPIPKDYVTVWGEPW
jgi:hypothetical protein